MSPLSQDPRHKNKLFRVERASDYLKEYGAALKTAIDGVDGAALDRLFEALKGALERGSSILVAGNGGSASISEHLCCDWMKGTRTEGRPTLKVHSLVSNTALTTAIANDYGYQHIFATQLDMLAVTGDVVVLISSSGNSPNVILAAEKALEMGLLLVGLTGFSGGKLAEICQLNLHVDSQNYGLVEDTHQAIMHTLTQYLARRQDEWAPQ